MSLKRKFQTKAEIPAEQLPFYAEREGAWFLDADPSEELAKLAEFRDTNIGLKKQLEALQQRFQGIDPEEVRKLTEEKRKLEEAQQLKAGEVDKVVENRIKGLKADWAHRYDPAFNVLAATGGQTVNMPFWQDLTATRQLLSDSTTLTVNRVTGATYIARIHNDAQVWSVNDLAELLSGDDPMQEIVNKVAAYWARIDEGLVISSLKGMFGAASMAGNLSAIHSRAISRSPRRMSWSPSASRPRALKSVGWAWRSSPGIG